MLEFMERQTIESSIGRYIGQGRIMEHQKGKESRGYRSSG